MKLLNKKAHAILSKVEKRFFNQSHDPAVARFNIKEWGRSTNDCRTSSDMVTVPDCKTQACVAGEIVLAANVARIMPQGGIRLKKSFMDKHPYVGNNIECAAQVVLFGVCSREGSLSMDQKEASRRLFLFSSWGFESGWPVDLEHAYNACTTGSQRAAVGLARIVRFRETDGKV